MIDLELELLACDSFFTILGTKKKKMRDTPSIIIFDF